MLINPTSERQPDRLRRLGAIALAFAGALMGLATLSVALADEPNKDIVLLIDNSRSVTEGDERRDIDPADATGRRVRLASFLVHYLDYVGAQGTRVGAITFADDAQIRVPLQKVGDWRAGDFKVIVAEKEGDTTNFVSALEAASAMLLGDAEDTGQPQGPEKSLSSLTVTWTNSIPPSIRRVAIWRRSGESWMNCPRARECG